MKNPNCAMTQHAFDITSESPPDAGRIAEMRLAASASRKEVDRRAGIVARATWFGMAISGTAAAGAMGLSIASSVEAPGTTADIVRTGLLQWGGARWSPRSRQRLSDA